MTNTKLAQRDVKPSESDKEKFLPDWNGALAKAVVPLSFDQLDPEGDALDAYVEYGGHKAELCVRADNNRTFDVCLTVTHWDGRNFVQSYNDSEVAVPYPNPLAGLIETLEVAAESYEGANRTIFKKLFRQTASHLKMRWGKAAKTGPSQGSRS